MSWFVYFEVSHTSRGYNSVANALASLALPSSSNEWLVDPPELSVPILLDDLVN